MNLDCIQIVLCNPDESRNIGSVCRAMKTMGLVHLRIIGRRESYNDVNVRILAVHAASIWENAVFFPDLQSATADCVIAAGTTRRRGKKRKDWLLLPEEFAEKTAQLPDGNIAVVFGNERTGLTDSELAQCTVGVTIPANGADGSLNLSHAVQIICYTLFRKFRIQPPGYTPVNLQRLDKTVGVIADKLEEIGFFSITGKNDTTRFWRSVLSRAALSESEAQYIEKLFCKAAGLASKHGIRDKNGLSDIT